MGSQNNVAWKEFLKKHPEYIKKSKKKNQNKYNFLCQCKRGHVFDYREREKYSEDNLCYVPCQGKCPICKCSEFSFIGGGTNVYPIKMNFTR